MAYGPSDIEEIADGTLEDIDRLHARYPCLWINVDGLADVQRIRDIGRRFDLHDLALEDAMTVHQRPKAEPYDKHYFIILRMPVADAFPRTEQVALFVGANFVISFQELPGDWYDPIRARLRNSRSRIRTEKPDFLAYALVDATIDSYFPVLEQMGEELERLENDALEGAAAAIMERLHRTKRDVIEIRRTIWPHRDMLNGLMRDESEYFSPQSRVYFRDCYDHVSHLMDVVESDREFVSDLFEVHLSRMNLRMNEIMKVLTIIATIFMPLSFVASLYGMNFDPAASPWNMPELRWAYGYPFALGLMAIIATILVFFVHRRGWLKSPEASKATRRRGRQGKPGK